VRLIKLAIISFVLLFIVATAVSLMIPSRVRISKAINIYGQKDSILALISDQSRWPQWHPAFMPDPVVRKIPAIKVSVLNRTDSSVTMQLQQGDKKPIINGWTLYRYASSDSLTLQWYMDFHLHWYPWEKFSSMLYESVYGTMMEKGLQNIKNIEQGMPQ
jgi:hypothetical protein